MAETKVKKYTKSPILGKGVNMFPYCPGCGYGVFENVLAETIEEMGLADRVIGISDIGCSQGMLRQMEFDNLGGLHGRALLQACAVKRCNPEAVVFSLQGDGAMTAIGAQHWIGAMTRAEKVTALFLNNASFGMTGGQFAPTTLLGLRTTSVPQGRDPQKWGFPIHASEIAAQFQGTAYAARVALNSAVNFTRAKRALRTALERQMAGVGYTQVEFISMCPTDWVLEPLEAVKFSQEKMQKEFPLGEFKNVDKIEYEIDPEVAKRGRSRR